jgi:hypothetical protein
LSEIVLHIGTHKTGTTALQETLAASGPQLAARGIIYPRLHPRETGHHRLVTPWIDLAHRGYVGPSAAELWRRLTERHAGGRDTLVLSSEGFSRARPQAVDFAELAGLVTGFGRRTVVCYLRNQADYIQSVYLQVLKRGQFVDFDRFVAACLAERHAGGVFLDYGALHARVRAGFAPEEIRFLSYEEASRHPGGIVLHFLEALGHDAVSPALQQSNVSPSPVALWAAMRAARRRQGKSGPAGVAAAAQALTALTGPGVRATLYTRAQLAQLRDAFEPLNRRAEAAVAAGNGRPLHIAPVALAAPAIPRDEIDVARLMALLASGSSA